MRTRLAAVLALVTLLAGTALAWASLQSAYGPLPSATGAVAMGGRPQEFDCTLCHDSHAINAPSGKVQILGVPSLYTPGQVYPIIVRLSNTATAGSPGRRWGFELTALKASDGTNAGTLILPAPDTLQLVSGDPPWTGRTYVEHTVEGTRTGLGGPVSWTFQWQAPATSVGTVHFFCAGNSADGSGDTGGDWIFTTRDSSFALGTVDVPAVPPATPVLALAAPWPNPARGAVTLAWSLAEAGTIELSIHDAEGRRVRQVVTGARAAGPGHLVWDRMRDDGSTAPAGTYFARLSYVPAERGHAPARETRKITLVR